MKLLFNLNLSQMRKHILGGLKYVGFKNLYVAKHNAYCNSCDYRFSFLGAEYIYKKSAVYCPNCGKFHNYDDMIISHHYNRDLPYIIRIALYEFKTKIELRIYYTSCNIAKNIFKPNGAVSHKIKEIFTFDIKNKSVSWAKYRNKKLYKRCNLGYLTDYEKLEEQTALYFLTMVKDFNALLIKLRTCITNKMNDIHGLKLKNLYVSKLSLKHKLLGNILNLAHRVRFFDSPNVIYKKEVLECFYDVMKVKDFEKTFEKDTKPYIEKLLTSLNLPTSSMIKKHFSYDNLFIIKTIYKNIQDMQLANNLFELYLQNKKHFIKKEPYYIHEYINEKITNKLQNITDFINLFYAHLNVKLNVILQKYDTVTLILDLWQKANKDTKQAFYDNHISFSDFYNWLSITISKQKENELMFEISPDILHRFNMFMQNHHFSCIDRFSQLKYVANNLNNCCLSYHNIISDYLQLVVISDDSGKPKILIEIKDKKIKQAKLYNNSPVHSNTALNMLVVEFARKLSLDIDTKDIDEQAEILAEAV